MRQLRFRKGSWIIIPLILISFFSSPASAENFIITEPTDVWFEYSEPTLFIAQTYMVEGFPSDPMLWFYNEAGEILAANDDSNGLQSYISVEVLAGRYRLRAGLCCGNPDYWQINGDWNVQYELGFNGVGSMQTTTTMPATTTTQETTTTTSTTTSTTTTTTSTTTTSTTTTTTIPATTTTSTVEEVPVTTPSTTTTIFVFPTLAPIADTTTTSTTTTTVIPVTTTVAPTTTTIPATTTTAVIPTTTSTTSPLVEPIGIDEDVSALLTNTEFLSQEEIINAVEDIISNGVSKEEATALATNPEILNVISKEEAKEIFQNIEVDQLTQEEEDKLVETLTNAPNDVKEAFQDTIDIFSSGLDSYVPTGSGIDVKTRRALIAATAAITTITTAPMPSSSPSGPSGGGGGGPSGDGGSDNNDRSSKRSRRK